MGEYGTRNSDGVEIKFGTCEMMYYLRFEDRNKVTPKDHSLDPATTKGLFYRIPFVDEDDLEIGDYYDKGFDRGLRLFKDLKTHCVDFTDDQTIDTPGNFQMKHESGLLLSVPCFHGLELPEIPDDENWGVHWNGKAHAFELAHLKHHNIKGVGRVRPVVRCRFCNKMWSYDWADVLPYIHDGILRARLEKYVDYAD